MTSSHLFTRQEARAWHMPIVPESYDRSVLSAEEWQALHSLYMGDFPRTATREGRAARHVLERLDLPLADIFHRSNA